MMNEYERMFRDGLRQAALRRPALGTIDPAEVMAKRSADHQPATEPVAPEVVPPKVPLAGRHPGVRWAIGLSAAAAAAAVLLLVPGLLAPKPMPAVPVATPQPSSETVEPSPTIEPTPTSAPAPEPGVDLAELTVSTAGWKTFSSPEYPITFSYPADWEISHTRYTAVSAKADELTSAGIVDGCGVSGCTVYVSPPGQNIEGGHAVVLQRSGFLGDSIGGSYPGAWLLAGVPDLQVWTSADPAMPASPAALVTRSESAFTVRGPAKDFGPPYELMLSTTELVQNLAMGKVNPVLERPEASFSFGTNWGPEGDDVKTVATILVSSRVNPAFDPTQPARDKSGRPKFWMRSMDAPTLGLDSSDWETLDVPEGNISLRVPPKWKVSTMADDEDDGTRSGVTYIEAPSGYVIVVLTNDEAELRCQSISQWRDPRRLVYLPNLTASDADGVARTVDLWWQDATWHPAEVWLGLTKPSEGSVLCSQRFIDYGGEHPVSVGSADNLKNPTQAELDQAAAILTSLERLS
jgi:hypothetical protein